MCSSRAADGAGRPAATLARAARARRIAAEDARFTASQIDATKIKISKYAFEAFPEWSAAHPDKACPDKLADLSEYMNGDDMNDAWGRPLKMLCGASLPPGARGLGVMSVGEDGKEGTADDLKSWD